LTICVNWSRELRSTKSDIYNNARKLPSKDSLTVLWYYYYLMTTFQLLSCYSLKTQEWIWWVGED